MDYFKNYKKLIALVILFIITFIVTYLIKNYFQPFLVIVIFLIITNPIYLSMKRIHIKGTLAAIISIAIVNITLFLMIFYFGNTIRIILSKLYTENSEIIEVFINNLRIMLHFDFNKILESGSKFISADILRQGATITSDGIISYMIGNVATYFMLVDKEKIYELLNKILPNGVVEEIVNKKKNLMKVLKVEVILVIISTIIIIIGFNILKVGHGTFLGTICGFLDILPYVGTIIVFIPIIIYNIIMKRYLIVVGLVALYLLVQIIREILEAKFLSTQLEIHPLVIMVSIYIGARVFGIIGIIIGPIYSIIAKDIIYKS